MITLHRMPSRLHLANWAKPLVATLCFALAGCATDALTLAPTSPSTPWQPDPQDTVLPTSKLDTSNLAKSFTVPSVPEAAILLSAPTLDGEHVHSLPELIDIAQRENPETRLAWNSARQAALTVGVVEATFLPMLSANVIAGWQKTHTPIPLLPGNQSIDTELHGGALAGKHCGTSPKEQPPY